MPVPPADPDLIEVKWRENEAPTLEVRLKGCGPGCTPPQLIVTGPRNTWFGTPRVKREGDTVRYAMEVEVLSPPCWKARSFPSFFRTLSGLT
ncbi:hypothetical protein [Parvibaculum sp.]|uniref:hypothetical protein n=1 Tax=Parvibaculum sp. TaxID=2024848 RepID=UPI003BAB982A